MTQPTLHEIRHSASHVLAQAVLALFPSAKLGIGPAIDEGFYYDFDLPRTLTPEDLTALEQKMTEIISEDQEFSAYSMDRGPAEASLIEAQQPYKVEIIQDLNLPDYSFYKNGPFVDLCRGPHVQSTGKIGVIKLLKVSGAYWRGSEKNKMLQRIYGTAFHTQDELTTYLTRLEEAAKRDHRLLGKELDLFSIQDEVGPGLILWHPKGARIRSIIEDFWRKTHFRAGYELLNTPHIGRSNLWETSGHLSFYNENMYGSMEVDGQEYFIKPMNCPFHVMIYTNKQYSYRDLPLRLAELGTVYRYERSGVLHGLMRVRGFTQDDAHIICTPDQVESEISEVLKLCFSVLSTFGFEKVNVFLSTRPKEKYVGDLERWAKSEEALRNSIIAAGLPFEVDEGGGAFYGPKIDIKIEDAIGREWQCSTIQFDFNLPERFDMTYIGADGQKHRPYMIHRALLGSIERFFGILVEHYEGKFPTWLAPVQVKLLSINQDLGDHCTAIANALRAQDIRVETDISDSKLGYKIRQALNERVPYLAVIGKQEAANGTLSVRGREGDLGALTVDQLIALLHTT